MKPMGWMAATAVMGIAIGFLIGKGASPAENSKYGKASEKSPPLSQRSRDRAERPPSTSDEVLSKFLGGRTIQSLSIDEIAKIISDASKYDGSEDPVASARRNYQLQLLLSKLPVATLAELSQTMLAGDPKQTGRGYQVFNAWARRDWSAALAWADNEPGASRWASSAISVLAATDPQQAADIFNERLLSGKAGESFSAVYGVGQAMAKLGKKAFLNFIDSLPATQQSNVVANSLRELPPGDLADVVEDLYQRKKDKTLQDYSFTYAISELMRSDPAKANEWLAKLEPGKERADLELNLAGSLSSAGKTAESLEMIKSAMAQSPGKEKDFVKKILNQNGYQNPGILATAVAALPPGIEMTADDYKDSQNYFSFGRSAAIVEMARTIHSPDEQAKLLTSAIDRAAESMSKGSDSYSRFNETDFKIFQNRIAGLSLSGEAAASVAASMEKMRAAAAKP